jgi:Ser/Thr protein kinase RdoA (MazF antagonist)
MELALARVGDRQPSVVERIASLLSDVEGLKRSRDSYGMIHGDFNDGNFTLDYGSGQFTVFDFDDCCYFYYNYELAGAWESGVGRTMYDALQNRRDFMSRYMQEVVKGYEKENVLPGDLDTELPMFLWLLQVEEYLHFSQYMETDDPEVRGRLAYLSKCIEDEIPYLGFFDSIYSSEHPFVLQV